MDLWCFLIFIISLFYELFFISLSIVSKSPSLCSSVAHTHTHVRKHTHKLCPWWVVKHWLYGIDNTGVCIWRKEILVISHLQPTGWLCNGQCQVICSNQKTDYTFSPGPLSLSFLIPLSVVRALELSAMYWPWSLMHTHKHTHFLSPSVPLSLCFSLFSLSPPPPILSSPLPLCPCPLF